MNLLMHKIHAPRKKRTGKEFLTLVEYLTLARRMICRFAPLNARNAIMKDDDAVGYVAYMIMMGDWTYDSSKSVRISTWRGYNAKRAINKLICRYKAGFRDGPEIVSDVDESLNAVMTNRRPFSLDDEISEDMVLRDIIQYTDQEKFVGRDDAGRVLNKLLATLTDCQRRCVIMHHLDGLTPARIAKKLGISHQGVRQNLIRAMKVLRETASAHV